MYPLLAMLNRINPEVYLRQVLQQLPDLPVNRVAELLPWNLDTDCAPQEKSA